MTEVKIINIPGYLRLTISGHAGYGHAMGLEPGHDIVCAAISTLGQTAAQCMIDLGEQQAIVIRNMQIKEGMIDIQALPKKKSQRRLEQTFYPIQRGFEMLAQSYPDYVSLKVESGVVESKKIPC